ncbi:hypothetical protein [Streptomyces sp. NPDC001680]
MSIRLMMAAAYLPADVVTQGQKLALMKICDSADDETRRSRPGLARLAAWAGVSDKRAVTIVTELVAKGLVERVEIGRAGRAAEYRVFPLGVPPVPAREELNSRRDLERAAPKNPRKARLGLRRLKPSKPAMTHQDIEARTAARTRPAQGQDGDPGFDGRNPDEDQARVPPMEPNAFHPRNPLGSTGETPSFPYSSYLLPYPPPPGDSPAADADAEPDGQPPSGSPQQPVPDAVAGAQSPSGCPKHPQPVGNCRGCGTNPRAGREQARREAVGREHAAQQERLREFFAEQERRVAQTDPQALQAARQLVRDLARRGRRAEQEGEGDPQVRQRVHRYVEELVRAGRGEPPRDPQVLDRARQYVRGRAREEPADRDNSACIEGSSGMDQP